MKTKIISLLIILLVQSCIVYSQNQNDVSKIIPGKKYKIVLYDDTEILGKVISSDSVNVEILGDDKESYVVPKRNILFFTTNTNPGKYLATISLLGGISVFTGDSYITGIHSKSKPGINFDASGIFYLSDSKAVKIDAGYTYSNAYYEPRYTYDPSHPSSASGGEISQFSFKGNILLGRFIPAERYMLYVSLGLGLHYLYQKPYNYSYWYYDNWDSTWTKYNEFHPEKTLYNAVISIGGSVGYRFTKHFGASAEIEFNIITADGFWFFGGSGYFPIRAGLFYTF